MRTLLYCVWRQEQHPPPQEPAMRERQPGIAGVGGRPVAVIARAGLEAATSRIEDAELIPDLRRIRAYEEVVEACFRRRAIVPMRYGSSFEDDARAEAFLAEKAERFREQLAEVDGTVEMGVRAVLTAPSPRAGAGDDGGERLPGPSGRAGVGPEAGAAATAAGRAYLSALRQRYETAGGAGELAGLIERLRRALGGRARRVIVEAAPALALRLDGAPSAPVGAGERRSSVALYFLVPREGVEAFREDYEQVARGESAELALSGPWPPYNFVVA